MAIAPVRKEIVVEAPSAHAFRVFTDGVDRWWPRQHHVGKSPLKRAIIEAAPGGRWYSICEDGSECDIGRVLVWDPPHRLVLSWQITGEWKFDPAFVTEVEVTFTPDGAARTTVVLEHRNLERYGAQAAAIRESIGADTGWGLIVKNFAEAARV
ncbi:MAG: SRPBCC family protein [Gemmatimonadales bacterium]